MRLQFGRRIRSFLGLGDTPASFVDQAGKYPKVNAGEDALEFATPAGVGDMTKAVYDIGDSGVVDDSEKLDGSTKAEVQDHTPKTHKTSHETGQADALSPAGIGAIAAPAAPAAGDVLYYNGANWVVLTKDVGKYLKSAAAAVEWAAVDGGGAADFPMILKPNLTRYVRPGWYSGSRGYSSPGAGVIHYIPIFVSETTTYIRICIYVHTGFVGTADLRIFAWTNGLPGALIRSAGTVDTAAAGAKEIEISQELTRGYYFLAIRCSGSGNIRAPEPLYAVAPAVPGFHNINEGQSPYVVLKVTAAYADPAPAPTGVRNAKYAYVFLREN